MKTTVKLVNQDIFLNYIKLETDWTAPYFPKVGDALNAGFFIHGCGLTPEMFSSSLKDSYRYDWEHDLNKYGQAPETQLKTYLDDFDFQIIRIEWDIQEGQTLAILYVD